MVTKSKDAIQKTFLGIDFVVLSVGEQSMVTKMLYKKTDVVPTHSHPNEQNGYVVSGKYKLKMNNSISILESGDSYSIHKNIEHSLEVLIEGEVVDVFTPPREDYL